MKEIKFRAKIKGDAGIYIVWGIDWLNNKALVERACGNELVPFKKIKEFLQFTGLQDRQGKEIFEGDIVKHPVCEIGKVIYFLPYAAYMVESRELLYDINLNNEMEVIGNIYENPKLLKP